EAAAAELGRGVAFGAALHAALARQQQDVVVVEDFHGQAPKVGEERLTWNPAARQKASKQCEGAETKSRAPKFGPGDKFYAAGLAPSAGPVSGCPAVGW